MMELEPEGHNPLLRQPTEGRNTKIAKLRRKNEAQKNEIHKLRIELTKLKRLRDQHQAAQSEPTIPGGLTGPGTAPWCTRLTGTRINHATCPFGWP